LRQGVESTHIFEAEASGEPPNADVEEVLNYN
jgi:hypothetical protein